MVSQNQFDAFKLEAIRNQPIRKTIQLADLKFHTMDTAEFNGIMLGVNRTAIKDLFGILDFGYFKIPLDFIHWVLTLHINGL